MVRPGVAVKWVLFSCSGHSAPANGKSRSKVERKIIIRSKVSFLLAADGFSHRISLDFDFPYQVGYNKFVNTSSNVNSGQSDDHLETAENTYQQGNLKIFLGYAAGVGKTYAMLESAHQRCKEGVDVVIGHVKASQTPETKKLIAGLEIVSSKQIECHDGIRLEMDVDAVIARQPALALVDELAHTNAPGSRHPKRYQDVMELLNAGVDVYTTLNIQNVESLNDIVEQITGMRESETIPDKIIDTASELELIDLPPDELIKRLEDGKVLFSEQDLHTLQKFYRKGNLTALREMALRHAAEHVDEQMRAYMNARAIDGPWAARECILVCISPGGDGEKLVRSARRLADELNADWFAIHVELPSYTFLPQDKRDQVAHTLQLADELGANTKVIPSGASVTAIAKTILSYAHHQNITKIVVGKPAHPRWFDIVRGSLVDQLIYRSEEIDVFVVAGDEPFRIPPEENPFSFHSPPLRYLWSIALVVLTTLGGYFFSHGISPTNLVMLYLLTVVLAAVFLGRGPSILASLLGVLAFDFFFVPPFYTFAVNDAEYILTFTGLFVVGLVISALTARAHEQAEAAKNRESDTAHLYSLSRELAAANSYESIQRAVQTHIETNFGQEVALYLPLGDSLRPIQANPIITDEAELSLALWAYRQAEPAGAGTSTFPSARQIFLPLKTSKHTVGVLSFKPINSSRPFTPDQRRMLEAFASQAAQTVERIYLAEQTRQIKLLQETEKLQNALLNSISHDLRTPLVTITGALTTLETQSEVITPESRHSLVETAREEAERLNRLVGNLLDMTRLESGSLKVKREHADVQDLIGTSIGQMEARLANRKLQVDISHDMPLIKADFVLIVHVLNNLLDNALKYSSENSPIKVYAQYSQDEIFISMADEGIGVPPEDLERIFDKFYRVHRSEQVAGTGLGLAICKGIIEAHGGRIWAENRPDGGILITFALPV
jgi:two-component system, OmpR family, sensor histidine kinase KdpD